MPTHVSGFSDSLVVTLLWRKKMKRISHVIVLVGCLYTSPNTFASFIPFDSADALGVFQPTANVVFNTDSGNYTIGANIFTGGSYSIWEATYYRVPFRQWRLISPASGYRRMSSLPRLDRIRNYAFCHRLDRWQMNNFS